jgi:hypothetical protein
MEPPVILHFAAAAQTAPAVAYFLSRPRGRAAAYLAAGGVVNTLSSVVARMAAPLLGNNHIFSYIFSPVALGFFVLGLAELQGSERDRRHLRGAILPVVALWIVLVAFVENVRWFDLVTAPLYSTVLLGAGLWTLLRRSAQTEAFPITRTDWFWVSLGLALHGATTLITSQMGALLLDRQQFELFSTLWQVRAALTILSFALVSWGVYRGPPVSSFATVE